MLARFQDPSFSQEGGQAPLPCRLTSLALSVSLTFTFQSICHASRTQAKTARAQFTRARAAGIEDGWSRAGDQQEDRAAADGLLHNVALVVTPSNVTFYMDAKVQVHSPPPPRFCILNSLLLTRVPLTCMPLVSPLWPSY